MYLYWLLQKNCGFLKIYIFFQSTITQEGDKLVHNQKGDADKKEKDSVIVREFTDKEMLMVSLLTTNQNGLL